jgi:excisionase family DNA binding protein
MVSTKLITIREAANRLGLKESTIRKYILKRQIAYVKPSVRAVRIPIEELERILAAGLRPVIPQRKVPDEPLEGVPAGARRRRMDQKAETGLSPGAVAALVLGMPQVPSPLGHPLHGRRRGCREADLSPQATAPTDRTSARLSGLGVLPGPDGRRAWRPPYLLGLAGARWGTRSPVLDLPGMALGAMASPARGSGGLDQGLPAQPSFPESSEPLRHQPIRPGSMWLREYVLVLETLLGFPISRLWEEMRHQWSTRNAYRRIRGEIEIPRIVFHQDLGGSALGASDLVQRHDSATGVGEGARLSGGVRMIWHRCDLKLPSLFGPACCGREATTYDRARKAWLCPEHTKERLCEFCQFERAWVRFCYPENDVTCEIWLCVDCAGLQGDGDTLQSISPCHPSTILHG